MNSLVHSCVVLVLLSMAPEVGADDCASIKDPDGRAYCRASVTRNPAWCSGIKDGDLRARCRAELKAPKK